MIANAIANAIRFHAERPGPLDNFWYGPPGSPSTSGITVTPDNSMRLSAVFACIRVLAETFASLPCRVYERVGEDRKRQARGHNLWPVLHDQPNPWQTSFEWREMGMAHLALRGNFYNRIWKTLKGPELFPLNPDRVTPEQEDDGRVWYRHRPQNRPEERLSDDQVFHVRGLSLNGIAGVGVLEYARNAVGLGIAQETHGASGFKNGMLPAFWIKRPKESGKWGADARVNFRAGWRTMHAGAENAGNPPILEEGMSLESLGLTNEDSQWIEGREFQVVDICRFFRVPPHLVAELKRATFSNIEQQSLEFVIYTMMPWCVRFEQAAARDLISEPEKYYIKVALEGIMRGDLKSRFDAYGVAIDKRFMLPNEARAMEDLDPIEGGDEHPPVQGAQDKAAKPPQEPAKPEEPTSDAEATRAAFVPLLQDAAARISAAEIRGLEPRAGKAASDHNLWCEFAKKSYAVHRLYVVRAVDPIARAWQLATGIGLNRDAIAESACCAVGPVFDAAVDKRALLEEWKVTRAATVLANLERSFFDAVPENPV